MKENQCKTIEEGLVDYADGLLDSNSKALVDDHLRQCDSCQEKVTALRSSLELAQTIWQDNLDRPANTSPRKKGWLIPVTVAASILLLVSFLGNRQTQPASLTFEEIVQQMEQEASAARLLAAADQLAANPQAEALAKQQYQYVLKHFEGTTVGAQARIKLR